jgi:uncharacterized OB-fold protein
MNSSVSARPDVRELQVPIDRWTSPFWQATAERKLIMPRCMKCRHFRWPPGPFCPVCQAQDLEWIPAGDGLVYTFTVVRSTAADSEVSQILVPALIEFPDAGSLRLLASIVDSPLASVHIGAKVEVDWSPAANATVPVFRISIV